MRCLYIRPVDFVAGIDEGEFRAGSTRRKAEATREKDGQIPIMYSKKGLVDVSRIEVTHD